MAVYFNHYFLSMAIFNIDNSQGSVATYLRCSGIFKHESVVANLPVRLPVKEF